MADSKISALPASTTPLAGTEVLPIVQSSTTKQVSVANLTAGRTFDALGMTLTSTDAGASAAPLLDLYRDSASPAASDTLGEIEFNGEDSAGNKQQYGLIHASILSPTSGAEQGQLHFETATGGASTEKMIIGTTNLVINEIGSVFNVRIEGDTDANLFYTDATNDRVGVGTASPQALLHVGAVAEAPGFGTAAQMLYVNGTSQPEVLVRQTANDVVVSMFSDSTSGSIRTATNHPLVFSTNNSERMRISSAGGVSIGTTSDAGVNNLYALGKIKATNLEVGTSFSLSNFYVVTARGTTGSVATKTVTISGFDIEANEAYSCEVNVSLIITGNVGNSGAKFLVQGSIGSANSTNYTVTELVRFNNAGSGGGPLSTISAITKAVGSFSFDLTNGSGGQNGVYGISVQNTAFAYANCVTITVT
jgi:hypothetical protein